MDAFLEIAPQYVGVGFAGYGVCNMEPDTEIVLVEHIEGKPRVHVYSDINSESPTHTVELNAAKQSNKKD